MATVNSTSTDAEVEAAYDDNASFEEDGSVAKAHAFVTAAQILLRRLRANSSRRVNAIRFNHAMIQKEIDRAQMFVAARATNAAVITHANFGGFR